MKEKNAPLERLKHHVTGAIERGEKVAIVGKPMVEAGKHTPGPWVASETHSPHGSWGVFTKAVMYSVFDGSAPVNAEANAKLAASAPELLVALEEIRSQSWWSEFDNVPYEVLVSRLGSIRHITLDALAKVKGCNPPGADEALHDGPHAELVEALEKLLASYEAYVVPRRLNDSSAVLARQAIAKVKGGV